MVLMVNRLLARLTTERPSCLGLFLRFRFDFPGRGRHSPPDFSRNGDGFAARLFQDGDGFAARLFQDGDGFAAP
jgi:hypothetical protein